jgi:hypothetical protein
MHNGLDLRELMQATLKRSPGQLLIVIDQFEEFVITTKPEQQRAFAAFVADLRSRPTMHNFRLLLVLRSEYEAFLEDAGLPLPRSGEDLFLTFLMGSTASEEHRHKNEGRSTRFRSLSLLQFRNLM